METPPRDEDLWTSDLRGSLPNLKTLSHNYDLAGFTQILSATYDAMQGQEQRLSQLCPFPIFQHAMVEILNARLLSIQKNEQRHPELVREQDALTAIRADTYSIPKPRGTDVIFR